MGHAVRGFSLGVLILVLGLVVTQHSGFSKRLLHIKALVRSQWL